MRKGCELGTQIAQIYADYADNNKNISLLSYVHGSRLARYSECLAAAACKVPLPKVGAEDLTLSYEL